MGDKMTRDEFRERLLADQELRRFKKQMAEIRAAEDISAIKRKRQERWRREAKRCRRR